VEKLPNGFGTQIGENGPCCLVVKKRIAIARALYKNPEVLLMDATSSLDTSAESIVKKVIDDFKLKGKTSYRYCAEAAL
jgi:ATP-binding cassette subfamily B protein